MKWPQHLDYLDTLQHPAFCFAAPDLRQARVVCDRFGVPRAAAGNFACVFQLVNGPHRWAVRCFTRAAADVRRRYALLTQHLSAARLPSLVDFAYVEEGIRIKGHWFPVVRMSWVDGVTLPAYVQRHLDEPTALRELARSWDETARSLRSRHIAHGDLQHGNILVTSDGQIRLVDYDAMYVPAFRGEQSPELGHPNWQHPRRTGRDYHEDLDAFSSQVVTVSLKALTLDPSLWRFHNGENLIFTRQDFENPRRSPLFEHLGACSDRHVRDLTSDLAARCGGVLSRARAAFRPRAVTATHRQPTSEAPRDSSVQGHPPASGHADQPWWWQPSTQSSSPGRPTFWKRLHRKMTADRDLALLIAVCAVCGILDLVIIAVWMFSR